jgi:hypothetical protein
MPPNQLHFITLLSFRAVRPGGKILVADSLSTLPLFKGLPQGKIGELIEITKPG